MKIELKFLDNHVLMTTPPCKDSVSLQQALSSGYPSMVLTDPWQQFELDMPGNFEVPLVSWRHFLRCFQREYLFRSSYKKPSDVEVDPLVYEVCGKEYRAEREIPERLDRRVTVSSFELTTPELLAIDPCYSSIEDGISLQALTGTWNVCALARDAHNGFGIALLAVSHESISEDPLATWHDERILAGRVGVDSGTCGFYDRTRYPFDADRESGEGETFYDKSCAAITCKGDDSKEPRTYPLNVVEGGYGVTSQTLVGDGAYRCIVRKNSDGLVVSAVLVFDHLDPYFGEPPEA